MCQARDWQNTPPNLLYPETFADAARAYVRDANSVVRQNLVTGEVRVVASFSNLSDICSFAVSPARGRWYFHHEGSSQFRSGDETLGYCDARFAR